VGAETGDDDVVRRQHRDERLEQGLARRHARSSPVIRSTNSARDLTAGPTPRTTWRPRSAARSARAKGRRQAASVGSVTRPFGSWEYTGSRRAPPEGTVKKEGGES